MKRATFKNISIKITNNDDYDHKKELILDESLIEKRINHHLKYLNKYVNNGYLNGPGYRNSMIIMRKN